MSHPTVEKAIALLKEQRYYDSIQGLMGWDLWEGLSQAGQPYRNEVSRYFTTQSLSILKGQDNAKFILGLKDLSPQVYQDIYEQAAVNALIKRYERAVQIPAELQAELRTLTGNAQRVWQEALTLDSFDHYRPWLHQLFELKKQIAHSINPHENPFDVLCDSVDAGIDTKEVGNIFADLKLDIRDILQEIREKHQEIDDTPIQITCDQKRIRELAVEVNALTGYDYRCSKDSETVHGMCTGVGPRDSRIAISYRNDPWGGMFTMLHEGGHGRYNYGSCERAVDCGVWGGVSGAMHEGQARFYENMIGRSLPFIRFAFPVMVKHFPEIAHLTPEAFYEMVNKVTPDLVRIGADELTYSLHPIIRFEIEQDYFNGKISTDDFMRVWNEKYQELFSLQPTTMRNGVLQDIHWASGHIGYFQSYTLGNLYGGQLLHTMLEKTPTLYNEIEQGNFSPVHDFLYQHIHQYGNSAFTPKELIFNATGEKLNGKYFSDYLRKKYLGR